MYETTTSWFTCTEARHYCSIVTALAEKLRTYTYVGVGGHHVLETAL